MLLSGSIDIDKEVYAELQATGLFRTMSANADEVNVTNMDIRTVFHC